MRRAIAVALAAWLVGACGSDGDAIPVVVSAPVSTQPWIARPIERGARLAVDDVNARGGVRGKRLKLVVLDNGGSPANALANAREAVTRHALALLTDGTGALSVASVSTVPDCPCSSASTAGRS